MWLSILSYQHELYPALLRGLPDAPPILYAKGNLPLLKNKQWVGMVGARNASLNAIYLVKTWSQSLAEKGVGLVSGFARGIDKAMHDGALDQGSIGVFAGGLSHIYPAEHENYISAFLENGVIIAENPPHVMPLQKLFPRRNRLIAGICSALLIIEAARHSGALITAQYAIEYGREIGVVPGFSLDPRAYGGNELLKEGAQMITQLEDIWSMLPQRDAEPMTDTRASLSPKIPQGADEEDVQKVLDALSAMPLSIDILIQSMPLDANRVNEILSELEIKDKIMRISGNKVALRLS